MKSIPNLHPDFLSPLKLYDAQLIENFLALREMIYSIYPTTNELLYHTHALTSVFTPTLRMSDGFCHIPIYSSHFNLGFNKGNLLKDPNQLLHGTGKLIRHIPIQSLKDFNNKKVKDLIREAVDLSLEDADEKKVVSGQVISKIKPR